MIHPGAVTAVTPATTELVYAVAIVAVLLGLAGFVGWRQIRILRLLPATPSDDQRFQRGQAWRRLISSGLMISLAGLLAGTYWFGQERRAAELARERAAPADGESRPAMNEEQSRFLRQYGAFWVGFGLVLLTVVVLAFYDLWALRRFARDSLRQIQSERRAMIEDQVAEFRRLRNGV
jgi:hypothetical protein